MRNLRRNDTDLLKKPVQNKHYSRIQTFYFMIIKFSLFLPSRLFGVVSKFYCLRTSTGFYHTLFNDPTRDSIANNFVISVYCRCLQILYQIALFYKI